MQLRTQQWWRLPKDSALASIAISTQRLVNLFSSHVQSKQPAAFEFFVRICRLSHAFHPVNDIVIARQRRQGRFDNLAVRHCCRDGLESAAQVVFQIAMQSNV
jgi:hypothetical protein